ncbi:MAG: hypothetical protein GY716_22025 [bacterium]|nr:hypothetical protein [bacterium]
MSRHLIAWAALLSVWAVVAVDAGDARSTVRALDVNRNPGAPLAWSWFRFTAEVDGTLYFTGYDRANGEEIWKSDGTPEGTALVMDLLPGFRHAGDGFGPQASELVEFEGRLYFIADESSTTSAYLYGSDGTVDGTHKVAPVAASHGNQVTWYLTTTSKGMFFRNRSEGEGFELWGSDGTSAGTRLVKDIIEGPLSSGPEIIGEVDGEVYFQASDTEARGLWRTDGTEVGTVPVAPVRVFVSPTTITAGTATTAALGGVLYFSGSGSSGGYELWRSDGTPFGTYLTRDIREGAGSSGPRDFARVGNKLLFSADDGTHGRELWSVEGATGHPTLIADIRPGAGTSDIQWLDGDSLGALLFAADDGVHGRELWITDGTKEGTRLVADLRPGPESSRPQSGAVFRGATFFHADDGVHGREVWRTNGTAGGTRLAIELVPGPESGDVRQIAATERALIISSRMDSPHVALWGSDGTQSGTRRLHESGTTHSDPWLFAAFGGKTVFAADDGIHGEEPWITDGTPEGTRLFVDVNLDGHSDPKLYTAVGDRLFFRATDAAHGEELWVSDGSVAGTRVLDLEPGPASGSPSGFTGAEELLFFTDGDRRRLWRSDGTPEGTHPAIPDCAANCPERPEQIVALDEIVLFGADVADAHPSRTALWVSDGSPAGTTLVSDVEPSRRERPVRLGDRVLFSGEDTRGFEPWISDGTADGTRLLLDLNPGPDGSGPQYFTVVGTNAYFKAYDAAHGYELWRTDGTEGGTTLVLDATPGAASTRMYDLVGGTGLLYFTVLTDDVGFVWRSDGSAEGTFPLIELHPPQHGTALATAGDTVYFGNYTEHLGVEPWRSDGTIEGTGPAADIAPGPASSSPYWMGTVDDRAFFQACSPTGGCEPYVASELPGPARQQGDALDVRRLGEDVDGDDALERPRALAERPHVPRQRRGVARDQHDPSRAQPR